MLILDKANRNSNGNTQVENSTGVDRYYIDLKIENGLCILHSPCIFLQKTHKKLFKESAESVLK